MSKVLVVDDDPQLRELMERFLSRAGFEVVLCEGPEPALVVISETDDFDVAVLDVWLGLDSGLDLYDSILQKLPDLPVVFVSGGGGLIPLETTTALADIKGAKTFLYKPFKGDDLVAAVTSALL
ncbi:MULTISPECIES: response regulator [Falsihalocynthiibacter]|uniref:response regulator n=1 Tax=Falsihalocynthiibacter TaxID=2854182 RepID=UPI0030039A14